MNPNSNSGFTQSLGSLPFLSRAQTRSVSPENVYGEKGKGGMAEVSEKSQPEVAKIGQHWNGGENQGPARELGRGWKVRPLVVVPKRATATIMDGDKEFPTICGTGTEDCFCGSYNFENTQTYPAGPFPKFPSRDELEIL